MTHAELGRRHVASGAWLPATLLLLSCADAPERRGDSVVVANYPPEIQAAYKVFAVRCSRCHTLARPLNARITDPEHWVRYVTRMRRQPTSGINRDNADIILRFLLYYTRERVRAAENKKEAAPAEPAPAPATQPSPPPPTEPIHAAPPTEDDSLQPEREQEGRSP